MPRLRRMSRLVAEKEHFGPKIAYFLSVACSAQPNQANAGNGDAGERPAVRIPGRRSPDRRAGRRHHAGARIAAGMVDDSLGAAVARARFARRRRRNFPRRVVGRPLAVLPPLGRAIALFVLIVLIAVAAVPLFRFRLAEHVRRAAPPRSRQRPGAPAGDRDRRRACGRRDRIRFRVALWRAHVEQALRAANALRAGTPRPRLPLLDPMAVRALVVLLVARRSSPPPASA